MAVKEGYLSLQSLCCYGIILFMIKNRQSGAIVMLTFPGAEVIDIAGPLDILCVAPCIKNGNFDLERRHIPMIVSEFGGPITTLPSGINIHTETLESIGQRKIDTLIIPGAYRMEHVLNRPKLIKFIQKISVRARRVISVCTGAFLLAEAGLLKGKRVSTHWLRIEEFAQRYPDVIVEADSIFVGDGKVYTSAGITSGMDLALHLVEKDYGSEVSLTIARNWLLYVKRPGGQSQFSALLPTKGTERATIAELQNWIMEHLNADLSVTALAERISMSPRHFARVFQNETGITPAKFVETVRIEAARRWLEDSSRSIEIIADECGMGDTERLRRSFIRRLGVNPSDYRRRFERRDEQNLH
ncbi:MAG: transcriptional regulator GlxA family with amidase domain [Planctomycetota bacterium]